jgi:DNA-binding NtrC family response regulator
VARAEDGDPLQIHHFSPRITTGNTWRQDLSSEQKGYTDAVNQFRKQYIANVLHECNGNRSETAKRLKMHRPNLIALVKKFGIE